MMPDELELVVVFISLVRATVSFCKTVSCESIVFHYFHNEKQTNFWLAVPDTWRMLNGCSYDSKRMEKIHSDILESSSGYRIPTAETNLRPRQNRTRDLDNRHSGWDILRAAPVDYTSLVLWYSTNGFPDLFPTTPCQQISVPKNNWKIIQRSLN